MERLIARCEKMCTNFGGKEEREFREMLKVLIKYFSVDDILSFYPKNLFLEEPSDLEFIVITEKNIVLITTNKKCVDLAIHKRECVLHSKVTVDSEWDRIDMMEITFESGKIITLTPEKDTNTHWAKYFKEELGYTSKLMVQ